MAPNENVFYLPQSSVNHSEEHGSAFFDEGTISEAPANGEAEMTFVTHNELGARIEAVEARLETRLVSMDSKLDNLLSEVKHVGETASEAKKAASNIKWNVLFAALAGIGIALSVILAMWAVGYQIADIVRPQ